VKVEQCTRLINRYDIDLLTFADHGLNMGQFPPSQTFDSFFQTEIELRSAAGHNSFENPDSPHQQGGTGIMAVGEMLQYYTSSNNDFRKLERWTSALVAGSPQHRTGVVTEYCVGKQKTAGFGQVYQQHLRYLQHKGWADTKTPYQLFCDDLLWQLQVWVQQGDRIILTMDSNEHVLNGSLGKSLLYDSLGLGLVEISHKAWDGHEPNTYIHGSKPIDGV